MRHELSGRVIERVACTPERSTTGARARSAAGKPHNCSAMDRASQAGKGTPNPGAFLRTPVEKRRCSRDHDVHENTTFTGTRRSREHDVHGNTTFTGTRRSREHDVHGNT